MGKMLHPSDNALLGISKRRVASPARAMALLPSGHPTVLPVVLLLALWLLCAPAAVRADCQYQCTLYTQLVSLPNDTRLCLLDCANCLAANDDNGSGCNVFAPKFNSTGGYVSSTCQNTCTEEFPAWAIVAISLGTAIIMGVLACTLCCCAVKLRKLKLEAMKARDKQTVLPTTAPPTGTASAEPPVPGPTAGNDTMATATANPAEPTVGYPAPPPVMPLLYAGGRAPAPPMYNAAPSVAVTSFSKPK